MLKPGRFYWTIAALIAGMACSTAMAAAPFKPANSRDFRVTVNVKGLPPKTNPETIDCQVLVWRRNRSEVVETLGPWKCVMADDPEPDSQYSGTVSVLIPREGVVGIEVKVKSGEYAGEADTFVKGASTQNKISLGINMTRIGPKSE